MAQAQDIFIDTKTFYQKAFKHALVLSATFWLGSSLDEGLKLVADDSQRLSFLSLHTTSGTVKNNSKTQWNDPASQEASLSRPAEPFPFARTASSTIATTAGRAVWSNELAAPTT